MKFYNPLLFVTLLSISGLYAQKVDKRNFGLSILKTYSPDSYQLILQTEALQNQKGDGLMIVGNIDFTKWISGKAENEVINDLGLAVHEISHSYSFRHPLISKAVAYNESATSYFIDANTTNVVKHTEVINSHQMSEMIPEELRTQRYEVYLNPKTLGLSAQKDGIYGLMNEWTAYFNNSRMEVELFDYYVEKTADDGVEKMLDYVSNVSNTLLAHYEFLYFHLCYLQYVKDNDPGVFQGIMNNTLFLETFRQVYSKFEAVIRQHEVNKKQIVTMAQSANVSCQEDERYFFIGNNGVGTFKPDFDKLKAELSKENFQQLLELML